MKTANVDLREKSAQGRIHLSSSIEDTGSSPCETPIWRREKGQIPSLKLTAKALKMMVSNRSILFQWFIIQVNQVTFREGNLEIMVKLKGNIRSQAGCSRFNEVKHTGALTYHVRRSDHYKSWIFFLEDQLKNWRGSLEDLCRTYQPFKLRKDQYSKDPKSGRYWFKELLVAL